MKYNQITYIDKIRSKRVSNRISDVFSCLTREVEEPKPVIIKEKENPKNLDKLHRKHTSGLNSLKRLFDKRLESGKKIRQHSINLYIKHATYLGETIPPEILALAKTTKNLPKHKGKHKKLVQHIKKERVPRKYNIYIKSKFWEERKNQYYRTHIKQCIVCQSYKQITVHHLNYKAKEYGKEKDEDLVALCWECHEDFHNKYGVTKNSHSQFTEFCYNKVNNPII